MANQQHTAYQSRNPRRRPYWLRRGLRFLGFGLLLGVVAGFVVMGLWNALLPDILGVSAITFWQALGLLLLSRILFGRYGGAGRGFGPGAEGRRGWKQKMAGRWQQLTPEQREQMKQHWRDRCNRAGGDGRKGNRPEGTPSANPVGPAGT